MEQVEHLPPQDLGLMERNEARDTIAPRKAMGDNVTIQKNWQELIRPNKLQVAAGADARRVATVVAEPLEVRAGMANVEGASGGGVEWNEAAITRILEA